MCFGELMLNEIVIYLTEKLPDWHVFLYTEENREEWRTVGNSVYVKRLKNGRIHLEVFTLVYIDYIGRTLGRTTTIAELDNFIEHLKDLVSGKGKDFDEWQVQAATLRDHTTFS